MVGGGRWWLQSNRFAPTIYPYGSNFSRTLVLARPLRTQLPYMWLLWDIIGRLIMESWIVTSHDARSKAITATHDVLWRWVKNYGKEHTHTRRNGTGSIRIIYFHLFLHRHCRRSCSQTTQFLFRKLDKSTIFSITPMFTFHIAEITWWSVTHSYRPDGPEHQHERRHSQVKWGWRTQAHCASS